MRIPDVPQRRRVGLNEGWADPGRGVNFRGGLSELQQAADEIELSRDRDDLVNAQIEFERAKVAADEKYAEDKDLATVQDRRKADIAAAKERILSGVSGRVRQRLDPAFLLESEKDAISFKATVRKRDGEQRLARASEQEDFLINTAVTAKTPEQRAKADAMLANHLEGVKPFLKPGEFEGLRDRLTDTISYQRGADMIRTNKGRGFKREDFMDMEPALVDRLAALAESEQRQAQADADRQASIISRRAPDLLAYAAQTGDVTQLNAAEGQLRALGHAELADDMRRAADLGAKANNIVSASNGMPFVERLSRLDTEFPVTQVEGAADTVRVKEAAQAGIIKEVKRFTDDPAGYVTPQVDTSLPAEVVAEQRLEAQRTLGAGLNYKPSVLTKDEATRVKTRFDGADADGKLAIMREFQGYGRYKAQAMNDAGIPAAAQLGNEIEAADPRARNDARMIISAASIKPADLPKIDMTDSQVTEAVNGSDFMAAAVAASRIQPHNAALQRFAAEAQDTMTRLVRMTGDAKAASAVMERNFLALDDDDLVVAILPRAEVQSESALKSSLRNKRNAISGFLEMPQDMDKKQREWRVRDLQDNGIWANAPDGDGLVLLDPRDGRALVGRRGELFRYRLGESVPYAGGGEGGRLEKEYSLTGEQ